MSNLFAVFRHVIVTVKMRAVLVGTLSFLVVGVFQSCCQALSVMCMRAAV